MATQILAAVAALALLTVLPGPDLAVVTRTVLSAGRRPGTFTVLGIATGLLVWGALTVAGLAALLAASATAYSAVKLLGAAYLIWLGVQMLWRTRRSRAGRSKSTPVEPTRPQIPFASNRPFRVGLVSNLLNPKIAVFYTGLLPQLVPDGAPHGRTLLLLVLVHVVLTLVWLSAFIALVGRAARVLQRPKVRGGLDRVTGAVLIAFGARVAVMSSH